MASARFLIWRNDYIEGKCVISAPKNIEKSYQLNRGISRAADWPDNVSCEMSPEFPKDIELTDNLYGGVFCIVSKRLRDFMTERGVTNVEYLPVQIINHKKKLASKDYFVLNPLSVVDCIDIEASKVVWDVMKKEFIGSCERLVIRDSEVPPDAQVFRLKQLPMRIIARAELANAMKEASLEGLSFTSPDEFRGV